MANKPSMKTQLSLLLGKIEATRGVDPNPNATDDAFLVGDMDVQLDSQQLERNIFTTSFSPTPNGVGRKVMNVNFSHEIKGSGNAGTRPKIGTLLRACGMRETLVSSGAAAQIETPAPFGSITGNTGVTWGKTTAPTSLFGSYLVKVVTGGASTTAAVQVFRHAQSEEDDTVLVNDRHDVRVNDSADVTLTLDDSDLTSLEITVGGTPAEGDDCYVTIGGVTFAYDVTSGTASDTDGVATAIAALLDADSRMSASASASVITVTFDGNAAPITLTSGTTAVGLGDSAAEITPTWTGNLTEGQEWVVSLYEEGYMYRPTSDQTQVESITLYVYKDGQLHKVTSCVGTVTFNGEAGQFAQANFEFQGNYFDPVEEPTPLDAVFEGTTPPQVELAQMSIKGDLDFCAQSFTFTLANSLNPKECINAGDGIDGYQITDRTPTGQLNPEATYEAYTGMWADFSQNNQFPVHLRVGSEATNMVRFYAERANFTGLTYGDRQGAVTNEVNLQLNGLSSAGDDELRVAFP